MTGGLSADDPRGSGGAGGRGGSGGTCSIVGGDQSIGVVVVHGGEWQEES